MLTTQLLTRAVDTVGWTSDSPEPASLLQALKRLPPTPLEPWATTADQKVGGSIERSPRLLDAMTGTTA